MTTTTTLKQSRPSAAATVIRQQRRFLKTLQSNTSRLTDVVAGMYLPGKRCTFEKPLKQINGGRQQVRPVLLTAALAETGALIFSGAIARPREQRMCYDTIFEYDISQPYSVQGTGAVLPAGNTVLASRANDLLAALSRYVCQVEYHLADPLGSFQFPDLVRDKAGKIVAEDYKRVLGLQTDNPALKVGQSIRLQTKNPAAEILDGRSVEKLSSEEFRLAVEKFQAILSDVKISVDSAARALRDNKPYFYFDVSLTEAARLSPAGVLQRLRDALPKWYRWEVSDADLMAAVQTPDQPLMISRLSRIQIASFSSLFELPDGYVGSVRPAPNFLAHSVVAPFNE